MDNSEATLEHQSQPSTDGRESDTYAILDKMPGEPHSLPPDKLLENTIIFNTGSDVGLTKREMEILHLIVGGQTNKQIAQQLSRSERTVEYHRNRLMRKMSAHNAAELVRHAFFMGII